MGVWLISVQQSAKDVGMTPNWSGPVCFGFKPKWRFQIEIKTNLWYEFLVVRAPKYNTCCARSAIVGYNLIQHRKIVIAITIGLKDLMERGQGPLIVLEMLDARREPSALWG